VDLILATGGNHSPLAAKNATSTIPIVFVTGDDPVADGVFASLPRPGHNLTGFTLLTVELTVKKLDLITELVPRAAAVALLVNPGYPQTERIIQDAQQAARTKGVRLHVLKAANEAEMITLFQPLPSCMPAPFSVVPIPSSSAGASRSWRWHRAGPFRRFILHVNTRPPAA
jgi:putative ABC transport system substrate-binding protein